LAISIYLNGPFSFPNGPEWKWPEITIFKGRGYTCPAANIRDNCPQMIDIFLLDEGQQYGDQVTSG